MEEHVAYLAAGKVHLLEGGDKPKVFESKFGQQVRERAVSIQRRHSWKQKGRGAQFMSGGLLWGGAGADDPGRMRIAMLGLARGQRPGELLYALDTDEVGGVFAVELDGGEEHDHPGPRVGEDGAVYCIRRPYKAPSTGGSPLRALLDFLLFPFRLIFALFQWLNFFTARYTGKPLTTAGGPKKQGADIKQMMVWGNLIDAEQEERKGHQTGDDTPALVPATWQLVKLAGGGEPEVLAKGVLSYDLCPDGAVVYTNGAAIYRLASGGERKRLHKADQILQVAVLEPAPAPE